MANQASAVSLGNLAAAAVLVFVGFVTGRMTGDGVTSASSDAPVADSLEKKRRAVIQFEVGQGMSLLKPERDFDERAWKVFKQTQVAYLKSPFVLQAALRVDEGKLARVPPLKGVEDQVEWLGEHLVVGFPDDGSILQVAVVHPQAPEENLRDLVEAIGKAYYDEIVFREMQRQRLPLQLMKSSYGKLQRAARDAREEYAVLYQEAGDAAATNPDLITRKLDIDNQQTVLDQLARRIAIEEVEVRAPNRIRAIGSNPDGAPIAMFHEAE